MATIQRGAAEDAIYSVCHWLVPTDKAYLDEIEYSYVNVEVMRRLPCPTVPPNPTRCQRSKSSCWQPVLRCRALLRTLLLRLLLTLTVTPR